MAGKAGLEPAVCFRKRINSPPPATNSGTYQYNLKSCGVILLYNNTNRRTYLSDLLSLSTCIITVKSS